MRPSCQRFGFVSGLPPAEGIPNVNQIQGTMTVEPLDPADVLTAVSTIDRTRARSTGWCVPWVGKKSTEDLLAWALADIGNAMETEDSKEKERCATNAVINARRALASLVDRYLLGFGLRGCKNALDKSPDKSRRLLPAIRVLLKLSP